ncbi:MAG TPA: tRNA uridine-5-carboxymethylaminomethyl(34) synthesis GTPase MnmE, partial [Ignavibacteriaceae bacterium]
DVRAAEPGEFTKRAFLNNRIDLTQAEAVSDLINSRTTISLRGARNQLDGLLSSKVEELRTKLVNTSSFLELELDFGEEEIELIPKNQLIIRIKDIVAEIEKLLSSYRFGKIIREGLNVVLVGEPNVGKSSILNFLMKESRAIVSSIPGTTRDIIREEISIEGLLFKIYDTAGFRLTKEEVEREGVERSRTAVKNADLILFIGDIELGFSVKLEKELRELNPSVRMIKVINKIDLESNSGYFPDFEISAKTGAGMNNLISGLKEIILGEGAYTEEDAIISNLRQYGCLQKAKENLVKAENSVNEHLSGEFIASDLIASEIALAEIIGIVTPDDILNNIFSSFCIGK